MRILYRSVGAALLALLPVTVGAQTGVSDDRVSLPDGPGSLEGVGENVGIDPNMGLMSHSVRIDVPAGLAGLTPAMGLSYNSGAGTGLVGIGWSMPMPSIERMTKRGLPTYDIDDEFVADGDELVRIPGSDPVVYRSRFEKGFVRYKWHGAASSSGKEGYWTAEYPDGRIGYFGADENGTLVPSARVSDPTVGTFRYHLVAMTDRLDHVIRYTYTLSGNYTVPLQIAWAYDSQGVPLYEATFTYQPRPDAISDGKPGFEELLAERLAAISIRARGNEIRRYMLGYEDPATSGGNSRLASVQRIGRDGGTYPIVHGFEYSRGLGSACDNETECDKPFVRVMNEGTSALGVNTSQGDATLVDINGDGLPDMLDTSGSLTDHRFFINELGVEGATHSFSSPYDSAIGTSAAYELSRTSVQTLDLDGNGFSDLINAQLGTALMNFGDGDWDAVELSLWQQGGEGELDQNDFVPSDGELTYVRFFDYDGDKLIDVIRSKDSGALNSTSIFRNTGMGTFIEDPGVMDIGEGFGPGTMELNDMNGDGLLDPVQVRPGEISYRINLGWGQWGEWQTITDLPITAEQTEAAELEDLNGDGLADLVLVTGNDVRYWLNRNGASFAPQATVTNTSLAQGSATIPSVEEAGTQVLFADMNGNGSVDVVWLTSQGAVSYLELFPLRPNLITKITNNIGKVIEVTYSTSALQQAADGGVGAWQYPLPHATNVVDMVDTYELLNQVHEVTRYAYHDGFYDGVEREFRGFARVESTFESNPENQELGKTELIFDVGVNDPYKNGLLLKETKRSNDEILSIVDSTYQDCLVAGLPNDTSGLLFPVRHICHTQDDLELRERLTDPAGWVTQRTTSEYDGYGNAVFTANHGVVGIGGNSCEPCVDSAYTGVPCGAQCLGDEQYTATTYVDPEINNDRWITSLPLRVRSFGIATPEGEPADANYTEELTYYDGEPFIGLPQGQAEAGLPSRVVTRENTDGDTITVGRNAFDSHGNLIERINPNGDVSVTNDHRQQWTYDADGLHVVSTDKLLTQADGQPYVLRRNYTWDSDWDKLASASVFTRVDSGIEGVTAEFHYSYDEFGRIVNRARPGATLASPSETYTYELQSPVTRIITRTRSQLGGELDLESIACIDGRGRKVQSRTRLDDGSYQVSGYRIFNERGAAIKQFDGWISSTSDCQEPPPQGVAFVDSKFDGAGRKLEERGQELAGGTRGIGMMVYRPLVKEMWDAEDTNPTGDFTNTPTVVHRNGIGQIITVDRLLEAGGTPLVHTMTYDSLGNMTTQMDPVGVTRVQAYDLLGRVLQADEPNRGSIQYEYDAAGNLVRETDGNGNTIVQQYDGANRVMATWVDGQEAATKSTTTWDVVPEGCEPTLCTNLAGRRSAMAYTLPNGTAVERFFGYEAEGKLIYDESHWDGASYRFDMEYDHAQRLVLKRFPNDLELVTSFDGADRLKSVPGFIDSVGYDVTGRPTSVDFSNGTSQSFSYDAMHRLVATSLSSGSDTWIDQSVSRLLTNQITSLTDHVAATDAPSENATFSYDALGRLIGTTMDAGTEFEETMTFAIDAGERITSITSDMADSDAHVGTLEYGGANGGPHAVTSAGGLAMAYNDAGEMVSRGDEVLEWDAFGRLIRVTAGGEVVGEYGYDPNTGNRRYRKDATGMTRYITSDFEVRNGAATIWISLQGTKVAVVRDASFAATALSDVAPATGDDSALAPTPDGVITAADAWMALATTEGILGFAEVTLTSDVDELMNAALCQLLTGSEAKTTWLHRNFRGDTAVQTDEDGVMVSRTVYYPYGGVRHEEGEAPTYGFAGKERDSETGLIYYGARYFDSKTGRWISPDAAFDTVSGVDLARLAEGTSAYGYAFNDPINFTDGDGNLGIGKQFAFGVVSIVAGAAATLVGGAIAVVIPPVGLAVAAGGVGMIVGGSILIHDSNRRRRLEAEGSAESGAGRVDPRNGQLGRNVIARQVSADRPRLEALRRAAANQSLSLASEGSAAPAAPRPSPVALPPPPPRGPGALAAAAAALPGVTPGNTPNPAAEGGADPRPRAAAAPAGGAGDGAPTVPRLQAVHKRAIFAAAHKAKRARASGGQGRANRIRNKNAKARARSQRRAGGGN